MAQVGQLLLLLVIGISLVLSANGYYRVNREVALFESDRIRSHDVTGRRKDLLIAPYAFRCRNIQPSN